MTDDRDHTDLDESAAAAVNRPPVGTHDASRVPDLPVDVDAAGDD